MISWKIAIIALVAMLGNKGNIYAQTMAVVEVVDYDYVLCVDFNGNEWAFDDVSGDWYVGDMVSCIMYDNGTDIIYDDEIITTNYTGWVEGEWGFDTESKREIVFFDYE